MAICQKLFSDFLKFYYKKSMCDNFFRFNNKKKYCTIYYDNKKKETNVPHLIQKM